MILTCPSCGTQYVVKDGAIPPQGRKVRCASCTHSWHQDPDPLDEAAAPAPVEPAVPPAPSADEVAVAVAEAPAFPPVAEQTVAPEPVPPAEERPVWREAAPLAEPPAPVASAPVDADFEEVEQKPVAAPIAPRELIAEQEDAADYDARVYDRDPTDADDNGFDQPYVAPDPQDAAWDAPRRRRWPLFLGLFVLLLAAAGAALYFVAPPALRAQLGLAAAAPTPLELMITSSDRQRLESGNELFAVSGRVINPTGETRNVPPITAELRDGTGKLVYSWTIAPPAATLPPGGSATFNSAEVDVPKGADQLTVTLDKAAG